MSAYDNPTIIQDMYGAKAWAAAANQVSNASVKMVDSFVQAGVKRAEKAEKEKKASDALFSSITIKQSEAANGTFNSEAWENKPESLIEQAKSWNDYAMKGGMHTINGKEIDFGIGSIKAEMLVKDSNVSPEEKINYMKIVNDRTNALKTFGQEAALVLTDEQDYLSTSAGTMGGSYFSGSNPEERFESQLVANSLYNKNGIMPDGFKVEKTYDRRFKNNNASTSDSFLSLNIKTRLDNPLLPEGMYEKYKDSAIDGEIVIKKEYNLSDGTWSGNIINPAELENADYISASKGLTNEAGVFTDKMEVPLASTSTIDKGKKLDVQTVSKWMDVGAYESAVKDTTKKQAAAAYALLGQNQQAFEAYARNMQPKSIMPEYNQLLKDGELNEESIMSLLEDQEMASAKYKVGLLEGVSDENGFQMVRRAITQSEIDDLKTAGIPAALNEDEATKMVAGETMQYFKTKSKEKAKTKPGGSDRGSDGGSGDANEREIKKSKKALDGSEEGAAAYFTVARTLGAGTGGRKLIYNPGTQKYQVEDKEGEPIGREMTYEEAKKLYR